MPSKPKKNANQKVKKGKNSPLSPDPDEHFFGVDKFLHEPNRLQIIAQLYALEQADMIYLRKTLGLTWGNLSFHATKLEERGYIIINKQFVGKKPYTLLQITQEGREKFEEYKKAMQDFLQEGL